jgi:hypothetical protein
MYVGDGGAGNFVKMVHNGIEYGDMQLISEAYDVLRVLGGLGNDDLADTFKCVGGFGGVFGGLGGEEMGVGPWGVGAGPGFGGSGLGSN